MTIATVWGACAALDKSPNENDWDDDVLRSPDPRIAYNLACVCARLISGRDESPAGWKRLLRDRAATDAAITYLAHAASIPQLRDQMWLDPVLDGLRKEPRFAALFGTSPHAPVEAPDELPTERLPVVFTETGQTQHLAFERRFAVAPAYVEFVRRQLNAGYPLRRDEPVQDSELRVWTIQFFDPDGVAEPLSCTVRGFIEFYVTADDASTARVRFRCVELRSSEK